MEEESLPVSDPADVLLQVLDGEFMSVDARVASAEGFVALEDWFMGLVVAQEGQGTVAGHAETSRQEGGRLL